MRERYQAPSLFIMKGLTLAPPAPNLLGFTPASVCRGFASKVAATGKTASPPVVRMGFALPYIGLLLAWALPL